MACTAQFALSQLFRFSLWTELRVFYVALGSLGKHVAVAYQLATPFTVLLPGRCCGGPSLTTSAGVVLAFVAWSCWQRGLACRNALPLLLVVGAAFRSGIQRLDQRSALLAL